MSELLPIDEAAKFLRINPMTLRYKACKGHIPGFFKVGREWRIRPTDLDAWIDSQMVAKLETRGGKQDG